MDIMKKLIRLLQDDYKVGVEMHSGKPIVYIDPDRVDMWRLQNNLTKLDKAAVAAQMAEQLDESHPGLSANFSQDELVALLKSSFEQGPFAQHHDFKQYSHFCLIDKTFKSCFNIF